MPRDNVELVRGVRTALPPPGRTSSRRRNLAGSGVAVSEPVFQVFTFRRGLVVSQQDFLDRSKALEAAASRD